MQENIESNSVPASTVVPATDQQPKTNSFLVILLSSLLIISIIIAGFFAYQTQKLVKELTVLKNTPTPVTTIEPVATADLTADWKTYTNDKFTFKYPTNVIINTKTQGKEEIFEIKGLNKNVSLVIDPVEEHNFYLNKKVSKQIKYNGVSWNLLTGDDQYCDGGECGKISDALQVEYKNNRYTIVLGDLSYSDLEFDQILSTFKFTDSSLSVSEKQKIEIAAKTAFVKKIGQEPTTKYGLSDESLKVVGDWAFGIITIAPVGEGAGPGANYFLARKVNNMWEAKMEYTDEFREWLKISPSGLVSSDLKQFLQ